MLGFDVVSVEVDLVSFLEEWTLHSSLVEVVSYLDSYEIEVLGQVV